MIIKIRKWRRLRFVSAMTKIWKKVRVGCGGVVEKKMVDLQGPKTSVLRSSMSV